MLAVQHSRCTAVRNHLSFLTLPPWQTPPRGRPQAHDRKDPVTGLELLQQLGQDQGFRVEVAESEGEDAETWEDAVDEMEDTWMREPAGESFAELSDTSSAPSSGTPRQAVPIVTLEELQAMIAQDHAGVLLMVDVRSKEEYDHGHVSDSQTVPLQQLDASTADQWRQKTVVVMGSGDTRSQQACTRLSKVYKLESVFHLVTDLR